MINISSKCLEALKNDAVQSVEIEVSPLRGKKFWLTEKDLLLNGFELENHTVSGEQLEIGSMTAAILKLHLDNEDRRFDSVFFAGAKLRVELKIPLNDGTVERIPFGVYTVDEQPRAWSTISLEAYDNMVRLDIPFDASKLPNNIQVRGLVEAGITAAGLACDDYSMFPSMNPRYRLNPRKIKSQGTITWRQVLMWCCQIACVNGFADENGHIKFGFYKKYTPEILQTETGENLEAKTGEFLLFDGAADGDFLLPPSCRFISNSELDEGDIVITGHQFKDGDTLYPADAVMDYGLQTEGNLVFSSFIQEADKKHFAQEVNNKIKGFTYMPYSCNILSFPHLQLLDSVDYFKDGIHHHSIITNITFQLNGNMSIAAKAKSAVQKGWASLGALTEGQRVIIDSVSQRVDETQADLTAREQFLIQFNEAITGSMGFYSTVKEQDDGSRISYMHDKPILEESQTIYTFGVNGFAWTNDGWNDGKPVWQSGFDKNGNAILNAIYAYKLTADVIVSGLLQSQNGASWINMDNGTFCFGSDAGTALSLDENKQLNVYGTLKSIKYPNYSVSIGKSQNEGFGSWVVSEDGVGDLMAVRSTINQSGNGALWSVPMLADSQGGNIKGLYFYPNEITINNAGKSRVSLSDEQALLATENATIRVHRDTIQMASKAGHGGCWINYYPLEATGIGDFGYINPGWFSFGNGTEGGYATINAFNFITMSDRSKKKNIVKSTVRALDKINLLKFYEYDALDRTGEKSERDRHVSIGVVADEAPEEIRSDDGTAIKMYDYTSLVAKAVQELAAKVEQQEKEIANLKAGMEALKQ